MEGMDSKDGACIANEPITTEMNSLDVSTPHRSTRIRKSVEIYNAKLETPKRNGRFSLVGEGTIDPKRFTLGDYKYFCKNIEKIHSDDESLRLLHQLMFGTLGKKFEVKKHIRSFGGFPETIGRDEALESIVDKKKWTVSVLKEVMSLFGLERSGTREGLAERLIDYLKAPYERVCLPESITPKTPSKTPEKTPTKSPSLKGKRVASPSSAGKTPKKRSPTAYSLFMADMRGQVKEENPDASFGDISRIVGDMWKDLSAETKEDYVQKAIALKGPEEVDEEEGSENEENNEDERNVDDVKVSIDSAFETVDCSSDVHDSKQHPEIENDQCEDENHESKCDENITNEAESLDQDS